MKKTLVAIGFILISILSHSCSLNNSFEQQKDIKILHRGSLENQNITQQNETLKCYDSGIKVKVSYVTDGDTLNFVCNNNSYKVRVIGIDTPETKHPNKGVECFGIEASNRMKELINGKEVSLFIGKGSGNTDKYGRLLRYVELDGDDIGLKLITDGYAFSYKKYPHERLDSYNNFEKIAKENNTGLWNSDTCNY